MFNGHEKELSVFRLVLKIILFTCFYGEENVSHVIARLEKSDVNGQFIGGKMELLISPEAATRVIL